MKLKSSSFTLYEVEAIKEDFIKEFSKNKLCIDLENITKIDMSAIQLLISLKKSCEEKNKSFEIKNIKEEILDCLHITGTNESLGV